MIDAILSNPTTHTKQIGLYTWTLYTIKAQKSTCPEIYFRILNILSVDGQTGQILYLHIYMCERHLRMWGLSTVHQWHLRMWDCPLSTSDIWSVGIGLSPVHQWHLRVYGMSTVHQRHLRVWGLSTSDIGECKDCPLSTSDTWECGGFRLSTNDIWEWFRK